MRLLLLCSITLLLLLHMSTQITTAQESFDECMTYTVSQSQCPDSIHQTIEHMTAGYQVLLRQYADRLRNISLDPNVSMIDSVEKLNEAQHLAKVGKALYTISTAPLFRSTRELQALSMWIRVPQSKDWQLFTITIEHKCARNVVAIYHNEGTLIELQPCKISSNLPAITESTLQQYNAGQVYLYGQQGVGVIAWGIEGVIKNIYHGSCSNYNAEQVCRPEHTGTLLERTDTPPAHIITLNEYTL